MMLNVLGQLLESAAWLIRYVTFDAHCAHAWFREALFGNLETVKASDLAEVGFFRHLQYRPLPEHTLPHFPVMLATYDGLPVAALPGVCSVGVGFRRTFFSWFSNVFNGFLVVFFSFLYRFCSCLSRRDLAKATP